MQHSSLLSLVLFAAAATAFAAEDKGEPRPTPGGAGRDAQAILAEIDAVKLPEYEPQRRSEPNYLRPFQDQLRKSLLKNADLEKELYDQEPDHPRAGALMKDRWGTLGQFEQWEAMAKETKQFLERHPDSPHKADVLHFRADALAHVGSPDEALALAEQFIALKPDDDKRGAYLLEVLAERTDETARRRELTLRIVEKFKGTRVATMAAGRLRRIDSVGKPFDLKFDEVVTGKPVSTADLKGKVVVIDFWATWCGPCVAEMPEMKRLYAEYKDRGVEFIGVSLDQPADKGGLDKLKDFVAKREIPWPQYYQGNGWNSEFFTSWGINSIPSLFIVDADGNLHSTEARGRLGQLIPELLKKRDAKKTAPR